MTNFRHIDVFNGDADGLCALHQLRLAEPVASQLITGVKRDIKLLQRVAAVAGDRITVLDVSLDTNREPLRRFLDAGVHIRYFDHHFAGDIPVHPRLEAHIDTSSDVCTSALVDRHLGGSHRPWAVAAAFGDNLPRLGQSLAASSNLTQARTRQLAALGELLNYNGYGDTLADLHIHPAELYRLMRPYSDPFAFIAESAAYRQLAAGHADDMACAASLTSHRETAHTILLILPDAAWARRVSGVLANDWARRHPDQALAVLSPNTRGHLTVSVRAPVSRPEGADTLCRQFPSGGGRKAAAGINDLSADEIDRFSESFDRHFATA